jgi:hypothetical protein
MPKPRAVYILLFRGVGGATQLPVAPLREALTGAGFENVATYINSGNAVLRSHLSREKVIATVAKLCADNRASHQLIPRGADTSYPLRESNSGSRLRNGYVGASDCE